MDMGGFVHDNLSPEEVASEAELYAPFTHAVRDLADAALRTTVPPEEVRAAQAEIEAITERLRRSQLPGAYGVRVNLDGGRSRAWGNAVVGLRNPLAPPIHTEPLAGDKPGVHCAFHLGAVYEGPPGMAHGGVVALVLDQLLGEAAGASGRPGMTGTLRLRYRQVTPLGPLRGEAWVERVDGIKTFAHGHLIGPDGVTAEAEGLFILPRWAREAAARTEAEGTGRSGYFR